LETHKEIVMKRILSLILFFQITILLGLAPVSAFGVDASAEQAIALFERGVAYGQAGDTAKALADYTAVIGMKDVPAKLKAMALFDRGVTYHEAGDTAKAMADYTAVIGMKDVPAKLKAMALF
jgi:hypothetical protein